MQDQSKTFLVGVIAFVVALVIGFSVGMAFGRNRTLMMPSTFGNFGRGLMGRGMFQPVNGPRLGRGALTGQIASVSGNQVTIKLFDGSQRKVTISNTTTYSKISAANQSSLTVGENIQVSGSTAQDGSVSAQTIRISGQ